MGKITIIFKLLHSTIFENIVFSVRKLNKLTFKPSKWLRIWQQANIQAKQVYAIKLI